MPNIPKVPSQEVLDIIDEYLQYLPISGKIIWAKTTRGITIGKETTTKSSKGYYYIRIKRKGIFVHHIAWYKIYGQWPKKELDHKDENKINNSILNLREVSHNQNRWNISVFKNNRLGILGIRAIGNKFLMRANRNGIKTAQTFNTIEEAKQARITFCKEHENASIYN